MAHILVVDDDPVFRAVIQTLLERAGHLVVLARDGLEAVRILAQHRPDLVLLDLMMPTMSGATLCRHLTDNPDFQTIPVIILSATYDTVLLDGCTYNIFLEKPVPHDELLTVINDQLQLAIQRAN